MSSPLDPPRTQHSGTGRSDDAQPCSADRTVKLDGERCKALRQERGLSRERLAALATGENAISVATIKRVEKGHPVYPGSAAALAHVLRMPLADLLTVQDSTARPRAEWTNEEEPPAINVLPLNVVGDDRCTRALASGIVEDLICRLGSGHFAVAVRQPSSHGDTETRGHQGKHVSGARYAVQWQLRGHKPRMRLTVHLVDAVSGRQLWGAAHHLKMETTLDGHSALTAELTGAIERQVLAAETRRCLQASFGKTDAWQLAMRGAWHFGRRTAEDSRRASGLFSQALEQDPCFASAHYWLIRTLQHDLLNHWSREPEATLAALRHATIEFQRSLPEDRFLSLATARTCIAHGQRDEALGWLERARSADPDSAAVRALYGQTLSMAGNPDAGIVELETALRLSPSDPDLWTFQIATSLSHFVAGRYDEMACWSLRAIREQPQVPACYGVLAVARAELGELEAARRALREMTNREATVSRQTLVPLVAATLPEIAERYCEGIRRAGMKTR